MPTNGCLTSLMSFLREIVGIPAGELELPYRLRDDMLSPAELSFYHILRGQVGDRAVVCPKVNLSDVIFVQHPDARKRLGYRNRIDRKHLDFVLCDPKTLRPVGAVELDDASHSLAHRKERDALVHDVLQAAGLTLVRVPVRQGYTVAEVDAIIAGLLTPQNGREEGTAGGPLRAVSSAHPAPAAADAPPPCPRCGAPMALRTAAKGPHRGERFWGCSEYPRCREVREIRPQSGPV